jgi:hypothetical protein
MDLAREHGISTQAVRNYERDGLLPAAHVRLADYLPLLDNARVGDSAQAAHHR